MEKEIWKDIEGFSNYQISNFGNVKTKERDYTNNLGHNVHINEKIMSFSTRSGYSVVNLRKNNKRFSKQIHRLVAEAFIPNPENKPQVNHKDYNRKNNCVNNLEWVTCKENIRWSIGNMKKPHIKRKEMYGITFRNRNGGYYEVTIKKKYIGRFLSLENAKTARDKGLKKIGIYDAIYS